MAAFRCCRRPKNQSEDRTIQDLVCLEPKDKTMPYIDMFVGPVLTGNKEVYSTYARKRGALTMKAGALSVTACWGDESPGGMLNALAA